MAKDMHKIDFDEGTLLKLQIFEQYTTEWLPVFIHSGFKTISIYDYFAGSGEDASGVPGSPLLILKSIEKYALDIKSQRCQIVLHFNEKIKSKLDTLQRLIEDELLKSSCSEYITVKYYNNDFNALFDLQYKKLRKESPALILIDQYGFKHLQQNNNFQKLLMLPKTDFLFFLSSSNIRRFILSPELRNHFPDLDPNTTTSTQWVNIHRFMLDYYRAKIPDGNEFKLYPFTIKKGSNIYGLIFGSQSPKGVEKFLKVAWNKNKVNGEASFDIDNDYQKAIPTLFDNIEGFERPLTKIEKFNNDLSEFILKSSTLTNRDVYNFALDCGHIPQLHAKEVLQKLKKEKKNQIFRKNWLNICLLFWKICQY